MIPDSSSAEGVVVEFKPTGELVYTIDAGDKLQIINLTFEIDGEWLVTDQPSHPQRERTRFSIDPGGKLLLEFAGQRARYERT